MKAQTCATLCSVLLFIGAPWGQPRAVLAENIPTIDGSLLDRTINVLRFLINDKTRDQQGAQEAAETILEAQRPCLAQELATINPEILRVAIEYNEKGMECLKQNSLGEIFGCFQNVAAVAQENLDLVENSIKKCLPDDLFNSHLALGELSPK